MEAITESFCSGVQLKTLTINSLKQTEIPAYAFYRSGLEKLNINVAPTKVGRYAFAETAISDFDFSAVKEIEPYAFADCTGLESVWLNTNIGVIVGEGAFKGCRNVTRAVLPDDMTIVPDKLFSGAAKLTEVSFNGFTVGVESFFDCRALISFAHTGHLRMVKEGAFDGCVNLQSVDLSGWKTLKSVLSATVAPSPKCTYLASSPLHSRRFTVAVVYNGCPCRCLTTIWRTTNVAQRLVCVG